MNRPANVRPRLSFTWVTFILLLVVAATGTRPANAIVLNDTLGVSGGVDLGTTHTSVVSLFVPGGFCSGALIDPTHILTARHCTSGAAPGSMSVQFYLDNDGVADATYGVTAKAEAGGSLNLLDGNDVAVLTLDSPAPAGVQPLRIGFGDIVGLQGELVGFGYSGIGSTGATIGFDGYRKAADNIIDVFGPAAGGAGGAQIYNSDFDSGSSNTLAGYGSSPTPLPNEGTTAGGDSGGPLLVDGKIYGVLSSGSTSGSGYGDISWWTQAGNNWTFIKAAAPDAKIGVVPTLPSDASFSDLSNLDVLNIDFGTVGVGDTIAPISFDVANLPTQLQVSFLDLLGTSGTGDTGVLTTDLAPFVNLEFGMSRSFDATIDTSVAGNYAASYELSLSDFLGTSQTLTLNVSGIVEAATTCIIGDANCDGYVDIADDIIPAFSAFTGPGTFAVTRADGDVHGDATGGTTNPAGHDSDVDVQDLITMFGNFTGPPADESDGGLAAAAAGDPSVPDLIYDSATGEVVLDVDGSGIIGYVLKNAAGTFLAGNHTTILGGVSTSIAGELSEAAFASAVGANSIGFVFPTGMDLAALSAYLSTYEVSLSLGAPVVPFDLVVLNAGPAVPEPSSYAIALLGLGVLLAGRRLRRSH